MAHMLANRLAWLRLVLTLWLETGAALLALLFRFVWSLLGPASVTGKADQARLAQLLNPPEALRLIFAVLHGLAPNLRLPLKLMKAYDNSGTVVVTRSDDVKEALNRHEEFEVVYGPRMEAITGGDNFFLGMQDGPRYKP